MTNVTMKVEGLKHLRKVMEKRLPAQAQGKVYARSLRKAADPMFKRARAAYNTSFSGSSGSLATATQRWKGRLPKKRTKGINTVARIEIGPRRSSKTALAQYFDFYDRAVTTAQLKGGIRHAHLVEFGFNHVSGQRVVGRNILGRVFESGARGTIASFAKILSKEIDKESKKLKREQRKK